MSSAYQIYLTLSYPRSQVRLNFKAALASCWKFFVTVDWGCLVCYA